MQVYTHQPIADIGSFAPRSYVEDTEETPGERWNHVRESAKTIKMIRTSKNKRPQGESTELRIDGGESQCIETEESTQGWGKLPPPPPSPGHHGTIPSFNLYDNTLPCVLQGTKVDASYAWGG